MVSPLDYIQPNTKYVSVQYPVVDATQLFQTFTPDKGYFFNTNNAIALSSESNTQDIVIPEYPIDTTSQWVIEGVDSKGNATVTQYSASNPKGSSDTIPITRLFTSSPNSQFFNSGLQPVSVDFSGNITTLTNAVNNFLYSNQRNNAGNITTTPIMTTPPNGDIAHLTGTPITSSPGTNYTPYLLLGLGVLVLFGLSR